ncbi:MAG: diguanylate cyclase [Candidatus Ratteibacteria bacterium]|jgi:diguanylate cyclase (GGDEF)-like protein/PAS domain S-box-containing protein
MDDDEGLARLCVKKLTRAGYSVDHALDGEKGLSAYQTGNYDVIILDHNMPVYDGLEVIRRLGTLGSLPPIIMVTGAGNERIAVEAMRLGARDYLVKDVEGGYLELLPTVVERALHQQNIEEHMRLSAKVFANAAEGIMVTDTQTRIISVNNAFTKITGYTTEEILDQNPRLLNSGLHIPEFYEAMWTSLTETGEWQGEIWNRHKNGTAYPLWLTISAIKDEQGKTTNYMGIFIDITSNKQAEERLRYQATHDPLTNLPNRNLFQDRVNQTLALAGRSKKQVAVMMLDLDHFKQINDTLGHAAGDLLLKETAKRLMSCMRDCDTAARLGGDEFTVLLTEISDSQDVALVAQRILNELTKPFILNKQAHTVTASIGISLYPAHGNNLETLLKNADEAMYRAKKQRNCYQLFT